MTHLAFWSNAVLALSFGLQLTLFILLVRKRLLAETRVFASLLLFYATRTVVLFVLGRHVSHEVYMNSYTVLALVDLLLQMMLALELATVAACAEHRGKLSSTLIFLGMMLLAFGVTATAGALLPARSPAPADRGVLFTGVLFIELLAWMLAAGVTGWSRAVGIGLAASGFAEVVSQCAKSVAAYHHESYTYLAWSYGNAAVYVIVLLSWMVWCARAPLLPFV